MTPQALHDWRFKPRPGSICHVLYHLACSLFTFNDRMRWDKAIPARRRKAIPNHMDFYAGKILNLICRIAPFKCGEFNMSSRRKPKPKPAPGDAQRLATPPAKPQPQPQPQPQPKPKPKPKPQPKPLRYPEASPDSLINLPILSARQAARRLDNYTTKILALAAKAGQAVPHHIRTLIDQARELLGCDALDRDPVRNFAYYKRLLRRIPRPRRGQPPYKPPYPTVQDDQDVEPGTILHPLLPPVPPKRE